MCGEKYLNMMNEQREKGSPPACAGKRPQDITLLTVKRDHPRVCGEKTPAATDNYFNVGSPPRVRGKVAFTALNATTDGITPACAGKSFWPVQQRRKSGEKLGGGGVCRSWLGSPPHVRGKAIVSSWFSSAIGITPACAGKRNGDIDYTEVKKDHPRMCGEKAEAVLRKEKAVGSPPHVRGKAY